MGSPQDVADACLFVASIKRDGYQVQILFFMEEESDQLILMQLITLGVRDLAFLMLQKLTLNTESCSGHGGIRRVIANNPGRFTFTGTGTYIVGRGQVAVIDPGQRM